MSLALVPCADPVRVAVTFPVMHLCPFRDEVDEGRVQIAWTVAGSTLELHALAAWLDGFKGDRISHEDVTADIAEHLDGLPGIADVEVSTTWNTAGGSVEVRALPR